MFVYIAGTFIIGIVTGWLLGLFTDSSSKRAVAKLEQLVQREETYAKSLIKAGYKEEDAFIRGIRASVSNFRGHITRLKGEL